LHPSLLLLKIYITQTAVEKDLAGIKLKHKPQLGVIDHVVSSQVQKGIVEICQCLLEVANKEIRDALLKVCYCQILIQPDGSLIAFDLHVVRSWPHPGRMKSTDGLLMLSQGGMNDTTIE
jgi:hypothetical protein